MRTIPFHPVSVPGSTMVGDALGWDDILGHRLRDLGAAPIITSDMDANQIIAKSNANVLITPNVFTNNLIGRLSGDITRIGVSMRSVVLRNSGNIAPVSMGISSMLLRQGGDIIALSVGANRVLLRDGSASVDAFLLNTNQVLLRAGGNIVAHSLGTNTVLLRQGADIVSLTMGDDTVLVKTAAGNIEALSMGANTVLVHSGGDIEAISMPAVADTSGSILVRSGTIGGPPDITALAFPKNAILSMNNGGTFLAQQFVTGQIVRGDTQGGLESAVFGANRFLRTDASGNLQDFLALTDWMLVMGAGNLPTFLASAANALVGKFGTAATAFNTVAAHAIVGRFDGGDLNDNVVATNEVVMRAGGNLTGFAMAADTVLIRAAADIVAQVFISGDMLAHNGTNLINLNIAASSMPARNSSGGLASLTLAAHDMVAADGSADFITPNIGTDSLPLRVGSAAIAGVSIPDSNFVGHVAGGDLGAMTAAEARTILNIAGGVQQPLLEPVGLYGDGTGTTTALAQGVTYFVFMGEISEALTTLDLYTRVAQEFIVFAANGEWAEVGVFTGTFVMGGAATLTRAAFADISGSYNSTGLKTTTIGSLGLSANDHLWLAIGSDAGSGGSAREVQTRGVLADEIQSGVFQQVSTQLSAIADSTTMAIASTSQVPPWIRASV